LPYVLGIDLGTTYTAAATHRDGRAQIASIGSRSAAIPSVVFLRQDEEVLTGEAADRRALSEPGRVAREFKRRVGDTTPIMVGSSPYSAEQLSAELLKAVVGMVTRLEGSRPEHIALCHPANWGPYKKELLQQAVEIAELGGPGKVTFLTEPEAAAIYYASTEQVAVGEVVAVYDLGGGTFDAAVLRKTPTGFDVLGEPQGIERLGGIDFDAAVMAHVRNAVGGSLDELDEDDPTVIAAAARLRDECLDAKEALSSDTETSIPVLLPNVMTEVRLTRSEFEAMIRPALANTIAALRRALTSAGVEPSEVSRVLLVGGSSRIPLVAELVGAELGRPVATDAHPKHAIALGAAIAAAAAVAGTSTVALADATSVVATPEEATASRPPAEDAPAAGVAAWHHDPTGRHQHRYWDGAAWTADVSDAGVAAIDPMGSPGAAFAPSTPTEQAPTASGPPVPPQGPFPGAAASPPAGKGSSRRAPILVGAAVVAVILIAIAAVALGGGGGGGGGSGVGTAKGDLAAGKVFVHHVTVPKDSVLLIKAIPQGRFKLVVSVATDFDTLDKYKTVFGSTRFGSGAVATESTSIFSDVDVRPVPGAIFFVDAASTANESLQLAIPVPFGGPLDIAVSTLDAASGAVTVQTELKRFNGPSTNDGGVGYSQFVAAAYNGFLNGAEQIDRQRNFTVQSDFTTNPNFKFLTDQFSDLSDVPQ
jgi:actin-like ATPase involved in cell morphogenesis